MKVVNCVVTVIGIAAFAVTSTLADLNCWVDLQNKQHCSKGVTECFTQYEPNGDLLEISSRGCKSADAKICPQTKTKFCEFCSANNCNNQTLTPKKKCMSCDSKSNANCIQNTDAGNLNTVNDYFCYTKYNAKNETLIRGPISSLSGTCLEPDCKICRGDSCNKDIVLPAGRTNCKQNGKLYCLKYNDTCSGIYNRIGVLQETGCFEMLTTKCDNKNRFCKPCSTSTKICEANYKVQKCVTCDPNSPLDVCTFKPETLTPQNCSMLQEKCFTETHPTTGKNTRGCLDPSKDCKSNVDCLDCSGEGCNNEIFPNYRRQCSNLKGEKHYCLYHYDVCGGIYNIKGELQETGCLRNLKTKCDNKATFCKNCPTFGQERCDSHYKIRTCYVCDPGNASDVCTFNAESLAPQNCTVLQDQCFMKTDPKTGRNTRGCKAATDYECVGDDCEFCHVDNCNGIIFPRHRKTCKTIEGIRKYCLNPRDSCAGVYNIKGELQESGCLESVKAKCDNRNTFCKQCYERCDASYTFKKCTICDPSTPSDACTVNPQSIRYQNCTIKEDNCFVEMDPKTGKNTRGCKDPDKVCTGDNCYECNFYGCNSITFPKDRGVCFNKGVMEYCVDPKDRCTGVYNKAGQLQESRCSEALKDKCSKKNTFCKPCSIFNRLCDDYYPPMQCVKCSPNDPSDVCTLNPETLPAKNCTMDVEQCYVETDWRTGKNTRGCLKSSMTCTGDYCQTCDGWGCNNKIFPKDRPKCSNNNDALYCINPRDTCTGAYNAAGTLLSYGCSDIIKCDETNTFCKKCDDECKSNYEFLKCVKCKADDPKCTTNPTSLATSKCKINENYCVTTVDNNGKNSRDCSQSGCGGYCQSCSTSNCNNVAYPKVRRTCYSCSNSKDCNLDMTKDHANLVQICSKFNDECFTKVEDKLVTRGCVSDSKDVTSCPSRTCVKCDSSNCNKEFGIKSAELSCYVCNNKTAGCGYALQKDKVSAQRCTGDVLLGQTEKCYYYKKDVIERGCVLNLNLTNEEQKKCADGDTCILCEGDECNSNKINGSLSISAAISLVLFATFSSLFV